MRRPIRRARLRATSRSADARLEAGGAEARRRRIPDEALAGRRAARLTPLGAAFDRWCVRFLGESPVSWVFARSEGVAYNPPILLTTRGRKSGEPRTVVLPHFRAAPGRIAVVGSRGGMPTDPYWARNLRAHPHATI